MVLDQDIPGLVGWEGGTLRQVGLRRLVDDWTYGRPTDGVDNIAGFLTRKASFTDWNCYSMSSWVLSYYYVS